MIRYALLCPHDHPFDSWFRDSDAFEALAARGGVACPVCGATETRKALMTPSVLTSRRRGGAPPPPETSPPATETGAAAHAAPAPADAPPERPTLLDAQAHSLRETMRALHRKITDNADNVGRSFAAEARAIHEKSAPPRAIYGEASGVEVRALLEDGIPLLPMPTLPDDHH